MSETVDSDLGKKSFTRSMELNLESLTRILQNFAPSIKIIPFAGPTPVPAEVWIKEYDKRAGQGGWNDEDKLKNISTYLSGPAKSWYETIVRSGGESEPTTWQGFVTIFKKYFPSDDDNLEYRIANAKQRSDEDPIQFVYDLYELCITAKKSTSEFIMHARRGLSSQVIFAMGIAQYHVKTLEQLVELIKNAKDLNRQREQSLIPNYLDTDSEVRAPAVPKVTRSIQSPEATLQRLKNLIKELIAESLEEIKSKRDKSKDSCRYCSRTEPNKSHCNQRKTDIDQTIRNPPPNDQQPKLPSTKKTKRNRLPSLQRVVVMLPNMTLKP